MTQPEAANSLYYVYQQGAWGEWPQAHKWAAWQPATPIKAIYQAGSQPIMDLRPFEFAVPHEWTLAKIIVPCLDLHVTLNEVARATLESVDCRTNSLAHVVQYSLYCDGSYTPPALAGTKRPGTIKKAGWAFIIAAHSSKALR